MACLECLKCTVIPQRVVMALFGFFGIVVSFTMRASLSVAITEMVIPSHTAKGNESIVCPIDSVSGHSNNNSNHALKTDGIQYNWSQEQQGFILSAFFVGYVLTHIPGGMLAERYGGKWTLSLSVLITIVCNTMIPPALKYGGENALVYLIVLRMLMGLAGGVLFPVITVLVATWIPSKERGSLGSFMLGGGQIGFLVSMYGSGLILSYQPWPVVFYFWSVISIIWFILFTLLCSNDPASHPFITKKELDYLEAEMGQLKRQKDLPSTPWKEILTSVPVLTLIASSIFNDCTFHILSMDLPKYMKEVLGFAVHDIGLYTSLPFLLKWIMSVTSGVLCDYLINNRYFTVLQARKFFTALSGFLPAIFIVVASYAGCNRLFVVICFTFATGFMGFYFPGMRINALDLSPNYSGSIIALTNGVGSIAGIIAPTFVGVMTPDSSLEQWRLVFWTAFGMAIIRTSIYLTWASADIQPWNEPKECKSPEAQKLTDNTENAEEKMISG